MKKFVTKYIPFVILTVAIAILIPGISKRITSENKNNNIVISVLYNDISNKVSQNKLTSILEEYKNAGINTISVMEDDVNSLVSRGDVTCIKYNVLRHKYDDESMRLADFIEKNCPDVSYDSYIVIASREEAKEKFSYQLARRYNEKDYANLGTFENLDIYVLYDGRKALWNYSIGYDEALIKELYDKGFNIALTHKVKNYQEFGYLEDMDTLIKKYNIKFLNLKEDTKKYTDSEANEKNYKGISKIINENDMTLVVTENTNQLSNQKFLGYSYIFNEVTKNGGTNKILRSYETYDDSQSDETIYTHRVDQFFNSTIDRNLRFITVTQIVGKNISFDECADYTLKAAVEYKEKVENLGYRVNQDINTFDYTANRTQNGAICAVIMVMCLLLMFEMIFGKKSFAITVSAVILAVSAFGLTFVLPESLVLLYPTVFCVVQSCTAITSVLYFVKTKREKLSMPILIIGVLFIMLGVLLLGALGLGTLLSGLDYYINDLIFRGIKLSLIVPVLFTTVIYYLMFIKNNERGILKDINTVLTAQIRVYWLLIAVLVMGVGLYYIIRSGNVSSISDFERTMRNTITDFFPARPRTKEFLIGYPALILFAYYMKKSDLQLIKWLLAVALSILAASITNSFCHVFTDFSVIVSRTINGFILGIFISAVVYIANLVLVKILNVLKNKIN